MLSNAAAGGLTPTLFVQTDNLPDTTCARPFRISSPSLSLLFHSSSPMVVHLRPYQFIFPFIAPFSVSQQPSRSLRIASSMLRPPSGQLATGSGPEQCRSYTYSSTCRNNRRFHKNEGARGTMPSCVYSAGPAVVKPTAIRCKRSRSRRISR